jgi:uncharacterized protein involved in exopolysaccharide biosynthesis
MTDAGLQEGDDISLFMVAATLLRNRWRIARWMFIGAVVAGLGAYSTPSVYLASASFIPQGNDARGSGLAGLAGQFGVVIPAGNQSQSPAFYVRLLASRALLEPIARDTFVVQEMGGRRIAFLDLFNIEGTPPAREEKGVSLLQQIVTASVNATSGTVDVSAATIWPSVSLAILTAVVNGVNDFNQRTRRGQATAERTFVEAQLAVASADLRAAEDRLETFLKTNRQFGNSPELTFMHDRLQREVMLKQQVFTSLTQAFEDARVREVRDTPVITIFEAPKVPSQPEPRGRLKRVELGLMLGGLVGVVLAFLSDVIARHRREGDPAAEEFIRSIDHIKSRMFARFRMGKKPDSTVRS